MYLRTSRLPLKSPKTFENFDFGAINGKHVDRLKALPSLTAIRSHRNIAFIGPPGTGKTHLAQAYGYECCQNGLKTYFIKMSELRDKFTTARRNGKEASCLNGLIRPACLIIDEVGHCEFDKENMLLFAANTNLFRQIIRLSDSLKPVERRVLYALYTLGAKPKNKTKSAAIVAATMKYHPHGDSVAYGAMVNLAQPWKRACPLVSGKGKVASHI